ncbi:PhnE/PtxC family ABC transporter permease [Ilumatobacter coccineus]|uniref:Phosphonate ABC transporter permease protein n=1 Tax=Ilumatobacter coccineus (strain NBRC 103263 / KCTC 29153 / YM16-304) TaxID=1313172 RepID=A0A6C7EDK5_ILUCY|nr:ABC transporter permease subunit [Ilumatobacter coccineus]BAN04450.1 phosphonate ABC transporter permease protein [Ilumatobacter coccineus YM16-304]
MNSLLRPRRVRVLVVALVVIVWSASRAGWSTVVNAGGWSSFSRFWTTAVDPELAGEFLRLTWDAALQTLAFAVLGSTVALLFGAFGSLLMSRRVIGSRVAHRVAASCAALPRAVHEILVALLLVQILGFDPLVAVLAIGIPFGAVTAKVYADAIDDADSAGFDALRATGANRVGAVLYGIGPLVRAEFVAYGFYRFECAIRSAAVLGIVGVGGLGFQLDLSFESLRYREIWTLIFALMLLSGGADAVSSSVRRVRSRVSLRWILGAAGVAVAWSFWQVGIAPSSLWSERTRRRVPEFVDDLLPPRLGPGGWSGLWSATLDTVALSALSLLVAVVVGLLGAAAIRRPSPWMSRMRQRTWPDRLARSASRIVVLLFRAVPAPIWAFLFVLILYPGLWPGAVALGIYNAGVLGRLFAEAIETQPEQAERGVVLAGATGPTRWAYGVLPQAHLRLVSLSLYRAEVIVRETIVIGVVGAGGLGQLLRDDLAARDFQAVTGVIVVLIVLAIATDQLGAALRRSVSRPRT